jgi:hypothetical protein
MIAGVGSRDMSSLYVLATIISQRMWCRSRILDVPSHSDFFLNLFGEGQIQEAGDVGLTQNVEALFSDDEVTPLLAGG